MKNTNNNGDDGIDKMVDMAEERIREIGLIKLIWQFHGENWSDYKNLKDGLLNVLSNVE